MSVKRGLFPHTKSQARVVLVVAAGISTPQITAELTGCSQRTVQRCLVQLVARGYVRVVVENTWKGRTSKIVKVRIDNWLRLTERAVMIVGSKAALRVADAVLEFDLLDGAHANRTQLTGPTTTTKEISI